MTAQPALDHRPDQSSKRLFIRRDRWQTWLVLAAIVLLGVYFRAGGLFSWDDPSFRLHPDERFFTDIASLTRIPDSFGSYFDSSENTLNPRNRGKEFYVYGLLPQTLTRFSAVMLTPNDQLSPTVPLTITSTYNIPNSELKLPKLTLLMPLLNPDGRNLTDYYEVHRVGRVWSNIWDCGSIVLVFLIGRRLYGRRVGLLAALFYALSVLPIQLAHFFTVDATTGFFTLLTIYFAVRLAQRGGWGTVVALGLSIGATMACRITLATLALVAVAALIIRMLPGRPTTDDQSPALNGERVLPFVKAAAMLVVMGVLAFVTFRVLQPDAFIGSQANTPEPPGAPLATLFHGAGFFDIRPDPRFIANIQSIGLQISGEVDAPPSQQWAGRTPFLFSLQNMVLWGFGLPLGLVAWAGWAWAGWQLVRRRMLVHLVPWLWITFYFAWQGGQFVMTMRYYALLYGLLAIFAAWLLVGQKQASSITYKPSSTDHRARARRSGSWFTVLGSWLAVVVVACTLLWAYAFTRIYTQPHSRITASRWIYEHIPAGATITSEEWDDGLPLNLDGHSSSQYRGIQTKPYYEDDPNKYSGNLTPDGRPDGLFDQLDQADYITLSSNRVYDSATRMPARYPALTNYYHYLFTGELGFKLIADIHSYPTLFGIEIPTPIYAEEAFSVYDHPRVLIFQKTPQYSRGLAERLITSDVAWGEVYKLPTVKAGKVPSVLRLTDAQLPAMRDGGTWSALFSPSLLSEAVPWLPWLFVVELLGLATFALLFRVLPNLPDRGFTLAKTLGVLVVAYVAWLLGSLNWAAFTPATLWLCAAPLLVAGAWVAWRNAAGLRDFGRQRRNALIAAEALFLVAFFGFVIVRALNPDLWHPARGGEKPMDLAFLTAVLKSSSFPPYDPWFAGGYINYYYFGFVFVGALVHLAGVPPTTAYNLAVPTIFALTALGAFGVVYNLLAGRAATPAVGGRWSVVGGRRNRERHAIITGVVAAVFVVLLGNLAQAIWFIPGTANHNDPGMLAQCQEISSYAAQQACRGRDEWAFWDATRIVSDAISQRTGEYDGTITEFPFFTFLYGDLHAHMIALPLALLALGLMVAATRTKNQAPRTTWWRISGTHFFVLVALSLVIGALRATNTWDYPTYLGLSVLTFGVVAWVEVQRGASVSRALLRWLVTIVGLVLLSSLLFRPFTQHFATDYAGAALWHGARTGIVEFLKINGVWLFLIISAMILRYRGVIYPRSVTFAVGATVALLIVALIVLQTTALVLLIPLVAIGVGVLFHQLLYDRDYLTPRVSAPTMLLTLWGVAALSISLMVELITSQGDAGRMNTVFKFGMQSWTLFALVAAVSLTWFWRTLRSQESAVRSQEAANFPHTSRIPHPASRIGGWVWRGAALLLIAAALVYPITATPARLKDRFDTSIGPTLDGTAYMRSEKASWGENNQTFTLAQDADALAWMHQHISGTPIILEAQTDAYHWAGRIATYTGLPTLLGWPGHETQQRKVVQVDPVLQSREQLIRDLYSSSDTAKTLHDLQLYGVEYVYVGQLERALYDPAGLAKFDALAQTGQIKTVYNVAATRIYQVPPSGAPPAVLTTSLKVTSPTLTSTKTLMLAEPVETLPVVNEYAWNRLADSQPVAVVLWLLAWYALLALGLPVAALIFGRWRDGGWAWSRLLGLLLLGYAVWLPVSARLWSYNLRGVLIGIVLVLALDVIVLARIGAKESRTKHREPEAIVSSGFSVLGSRFSKGLAVLWERLRAQRRRIVLTEALFLVPFGIMLTLRALNPDLWQPIWGGEKPFEFAFLNAVLRSPVMPPYNPFFSDGIINYYYYGLFLVSLPIKMIGVAPAVGFNLVIATLFALMLTGAFALVAHLTAKVRFGLVGAVAVTITGNLATVFTVGWGQGLTPVRAALEQGVSGFGARLGDWFVGPSRVIPNTINEFPYWSYLFADLHPHLIAMPITLLAIALAVCLFDDRHPSHASRSPFPDTQARGGERWGAIGIAALTLGALAVTNSWDFPTYALLIAGALLGAAWRGRRTLGGWVQALVQTLAVMGGALLLYLPFFQNFQAQVRGVSLVQNGTSLRDYALIYGLFLLVLVPVVLGAVWRVLQVRAEPLPVLAPEALGFVAASRQPLAMRQRLPLVVICGLALTALASVAAPPLALKLWLGALIIVAALVLRDRRIAPMTWFALWLAVVAWAVSLGVEFVYIRDHLADGDWARMNTVFKFGLQAWILLSVAAAALLPLLLGALRRLGALAECLGWMLLAMAGCVALIFPLVGTPSRVAYRFPATPPPTLDGLAFMQQGVYDWNGHTIRLRDDGDAIRWLNTHITGTPIVLQSSQEFYRAYGVRIAANTGFPTIVSPLHESEQRPPELVSQRDGDVNTLYSTTDVAQTLQLLAHYRVGYVYVGAIERAAYGDAGVAKFDRMVDAYLSVVYQNPTVKIYKVNDSVAGITAAVPVDTFAPAAQPAAQPAADQPALESLEAEVAADPTVPGPAFNLAGRYRSLGRLDDAAAVLAKAAAANPRDVAMHQLLGDVLRDAGRQDEAETAYRQAAEAGPTAGNYNKLGTELLKMNRIDKALEAFQQGVKAGNDDPSPYFYLGQIYEQRGEREQATQSYNQYLNAAPDGPYRAQATKALERLK